MVAKHVNKEKCWKKTSVLAINALLHSLTALTATFRAVVFYRYLSNDKSSHRPSEFCANLMYHYSDPG